MKFLFLPFLFFLLSSCTLNSQKISSKPVIKVNDHALTVKEYSTLLARRLKDLDALGAKDIAVVNTAKADLARDYIIRCLILDWSKANSIQVSEKDLDKEIDKYRSNYPDDLSFRRMLAEENLSFSDWREKLRYTLFERAFFQKLSENTTKPTDEELKKYYEEKKSQFKVKERVYLRQIVLDESSRAELIKNELKSKDFATLAKKYSIAPEAKNGGLVGWIEKGSVDFFDSTFTLPLGVASSIIKSPFGFHIIRIEKKLPAGTKSLDEVRTLLLQDLLAKKEQAAFVSWLDGQIRSSHIFKDYDLINSVIVDTKLTND